MARRTAQPPAEVPLYLTMPREEASRKIGERIEKGAVLKTLSMDDDLALRDAERRYTTWSEYNQEMLRRMFTSSTIADEYGSPGGTFAFTRELPIGVQISYLHALIDTKVGNLGSVNDRLELIPLSPGVGQAPPLSKTSPSVASH